MDDTVRLGVPLLTYSGMAALAISAAFFDLRTRRIPNALVVMGAGLGVVLTIWQLGWAGSLEGLLGLVTGFALFLPGYLLRMTGGGDLKLMAALGTFLGAKLIIYAFMLYILAGVIWALAYSIYASIRRGCDPPFARYWAMLRTLIATGQFAYIRPRPNEFMGQRLPMAPAIAFGALMAPLLFSS